MDSRKEGRVWAWIALVVLAVVVWGLTFTRKEVRADVFIDAPSGQVWRVVTNFHDYPKWNPYIRQISGTLAPGERLTVVLQPVGSRSTVIHPVVLSVIPSQQINWRERLVMPWIFDGNYTMTLEPISDTQTRVYQKEVYTGLIVLPSLRWLEESVQTGMIRMNTALKYYVEGRPMMLDESELQQLPPGQIHAPGSPTQMPEISGKHSLASGEP